MSAGGSGIEVVFRIFMSQDARYVVSRTADAVLRRCCQPLRSRDDTILVGLSYEKKLDR